MQATPGLKGACSICVAAIHLLLPAAGIAGASVPPGAREFELLRAQVSAQQSQIDELRRLLEEQRTLLAAVIAGRVPSPAASGIAATWATGAPGQPAVAAAHTGSDPPAQTPSAAAGPLNFRVGSVVFTPSGYMEFAAVVRDRTVGSGIATNYGSIPFDDSVNGQLREYQFSAQTSRLGLRMDSVVKGADVRGYLETDFLGIVPGNVAVTSNSDTLRLRLFWADIRKNQFEFLAGQAFTMMTPNRRGVSALSADLFLPQVIDPNLHVGMVWNRNPQLRFVYHASDAIALGVSAEASEQYGGGGSGSGVVTLPSELAPYYSGQINTGSGSYATPNPHQDIVAKVAFDPTVHDKAVHVEAGGVLTTFAFYNPLDGRHYGTTGGGGSLNVNVEPAKSLRLFANAFYSRGAGRYLIGLGPDVIIRGDGSPSPVGSSSLLIGVEHQSTPRTAIQGYFGAARFDRNVAIDPVTGGEVGFGYVGSPSNHNRIVTQGTLAFSHALWGDSRLGGLQVMAQYSHLFREPWYVTPGASSSASLNLFYLKIRYSFPGAPPAQPVTR
jgi:hypothetical protein